MSISLPRMMAEVAVMKLAGWRQQQRSPVLRLRPAPQQAEGWAGQAVLHEASGPSLLLWIPG